MTSPIPAPATTERATDAPALERILATKLYIPAARTHRVPRPRLIERLEAGDGGTLTLVSAPAGFGKSTALSEWVHDTGRRVAWVSLDKGDGDLSRFLTYVVAALRMLQPGLGAEVLAALRSPQPLAPEVVEALLTGLLNEIHGTPGELVLALDDYHVVESREVHQAVQFVLDRLPANLRLVLSTRVDPPLALSRLRARGQLIELRAADLRFTPAEAARFLNEAMGLALSAADVEALEERTEGWAVGLQMAALSLQGRRDVGAFIGHFTGSHRYVLDYLTDEVLSRQPQRVRDFLLQTSILSRLSGPLADALTGRGDGQALLEELEAANLFLVPLDDVREWYRYHHLFGTLLCHQLERTAGKPAMAALHLAACDWYAAHGYPEDALEHALAAGDFDRAAGLVEENALPSIMRGEVGAPVRWLASLPPELVRARPRLALGQAWTMAANLQWEEAAAAVDEAERALAATPDPALAIHAAALRGLLGRIRGESGISIPLLEEGLERLPREDLFIRSIVALDLGIAYRETGDPEAAQRTFAVAVDLARQCHNVLGGLLAHWHLADIEVEAGRLRRGFETHARAPRLAAETSDRETPAAAALGIAWVGMADLHREWNELALASELATRAVDLGRRGGPASNVLQGLVALARTLRAQGDFEAALAALAETESLMRRTGVPRWVRHVEAHRGVILLAQAAAEGREPPLEAAARWAREIGFYDGERPSFRIFLAGQPREFLDLAFARLLVAGGEAARALALLEGLLGPAEADGLDRSVVEIRMLEALARRAAGDEPGAEAALERALALAEPEGYVRLFADEGPAMAELLDRTAPRAVSPAYARRLLAAVDRAPATTATAPRPEARAGAPEVLSERELEVLRLVARGLTNAEAGRKLFIAPSTVKKHLENIYGKIGARNRTEAIARAQELELL